ncbi:MAG: hypothetical protein ACXVZM_07960 [Terriglobales bacterium]
MVSKIAAAGLALSLGIGAWAQTPPQPPSSKKGAVPKSAKKPSPAKPQPQLTPEPQPAPQPVEPPRPYQMAPVPPQVTYQNGQLSIFAPNSTLSSILSAVKARTGAQVDMPADTANDRVAVQLGPGNPRDVVASLLEGSRFDYIVLGSPTNPVELAQVILTVHQGGSTGASATGNATAQAAQAGGSRPNPQQPRIAGGAGRPEIVADDEDTAPEPQPVQPQVEETPQQPMVQPGVAQPGMPQPGMVQPGMPQPQMGQPGMPQPQRGQPGVQYPDGNQQNPNQVKTPEQLLQELQQMQQQQQQQQQQQGRQPPQEEP